MEMTCIFFDIELLYNKRFMNKFKKNYENQ